VVDPGVQGQHYLEGLIGQRTQCGQFGSEFGANVLDVAEDVAGVVFGISQSNQLVQFAQRLDFGQRDQVTPAEATHFTFDTALGLTRRLHPIGRVHNNRFG
jgi:hypothetical protein